MSFVLATLVGILFALGAYLLLDRDLVRVVMGFMLMANAVNLVVVLAAGERTMVVEGEATTRADPLAQAMVLTAIVITVGVLSLFLAMTAWQADHDDDASGTAEDTG